MSLEELRFSEYCANCRKSLANLAKVLFVEKEVGRCFCCEECIRDYFQPTVEFMEEELRRLRSESDISDSDSSQFSHYRSLTLEDPDEVWLEQTETGERHFTFITHFRHRDERLSYVVVCLAIDEVPSYVFLSFPTRDDDLVDEYRRGVDLRINDEPSDGPPPMAPEGDLSSGLDQIPTHGAELKKLYEEARQPGDIPREAFDKFEPFIDLTLDDADEIWSFIDDEGNEWCTFIAKHGADAPDSEIEEFNMIVVCEPALEEGTAAKTFEVIFAFPTIDPGLVQHFRKGVNSLNKAFGVGWTRGRAA